MTDHLAETGSTNRVERTFAFVDLSGFTAFTDARGDDEAVNVLGEFRAAVRETASSHAVRVAKWLGDGAMLVGVEAEPLIEAVVDLDQRVVAQGCPLPLRAGICTGRVILFEGDDYIGHAVNLAARLCEEADPHEILAQASSVSSLLVNTEVESVGRRHISGLEEPVEVVRLHAPR